MPRIVLRIGFVLSLLFSLYGVAGCFGGSGRNGAKDGPEIVEGGVILRYSDREAERVYVVGDFNGWSPRADAMVDENGDGVWTLFLTLPPGVYEYKFVVNHNLWIPDPNNPEKVPDGFDGENSVLRISKR